MLLITFMALGKMLSSSGAVSVLILTNMKIQHFTKLLLGHLLGRIQKTSYHTQSAVGAAGNLGYQTMSGAGSLSKNGKFIFVHLGNLLICVYRNSYDYVPGMNTLVTKPSRGEVSIEKLVNAPLSMTGLELERFATVWAPGEAQGELSDL